MVKLVSKEGYDKDGNSFFYFKHSFTIPIYDWEVIVSYAVDIARVRELDVFTRKLGNSHTIGRNTLAFCETPDGACATYLFFPLNSVTLLPISYATVAHEAFHCAAKIMRSLGIDDEEATAYLLEYITERIINFSYRIMDFAEETKKVLDK